MKKAIAILTMALLAGCQSSNQYGRCIGAFEEGEPGVKYQLSVRNTVIAVIFFETIFTPIVVVAKEAKCPINTPPEVTTK